MFHYFIIFISAGEKASFSDSDYVKAGAIIFQGDQLVPQADLITKIRPPNDDEIPKLAGKTLISMISPSINKDLYSTLAAQNTNVFALDCVPRMLSRAQAFDVLSSQANIAGYRSVIEAAELFPRFFAGQMTAAGKVPPAKVLVVRRFSRLRLNKSLLTFHCVSILTVFLSCDLTTLICLARRGSCWSSSNPNCEEYGSYRSSFRCSTCDKRASRIYGSNVFGSSNSRRWIRNRRIRKRDVW